jgi:hypothetical protein
MLQNANRLHALLDELLEPLQTAWLWFAAEPLQRRLAGLNT